MAAKRVIVLDSFNEPWRYRIAFWADVPAARQAFYANANAVSAWKGASAGENSAIASGAVVERVIEYAVLTGMGLAALQADLQAKWQAFQDEITAANHWARYGSFWDGVAWTLVTGA